MHCFSSRWHASSRIPKLQGVPWLALLLTLLASVYTSVVCAEPVGDGSDSVASSPPGTADFIQYWSAFQIFQRGENPYDSQLLHAEQVRGGGASARTVSLWNPPWTVLVMSPLLGTDLLSAAKTWVAANGCLILLMIVCLSRLEPGADKLGLFSAGLLVLAFYPVWETIWWGQTSILLAAAFIVGIWLTTRSWDLASGVLLSLLSIKPHLFLPSAILILFWVLQTRRWRLPCGLLLGLALLTVGTELFWPNSLSWWWSSFGGSPDAPGAVSILEWKTATTAGAIRSLLYTPGSPVPVWPMVVLPLSAISLVLLWLAISRPKIELLRHLPPVQCLALLAAPYGWRCDQTVLVFTLACLCAGTGVSKHRVWRLVLLAELLLFLLSLLPGASPHYFFWFPALVLLVWHDHLR